MINCSPRSAAVWEVSTARRIIAYWETQVSQHIQKWSSRHENRCLNFQIRVIINSFFLRETQYSLRLYKLLVAITYSNLSQMTWRQFLQWVKNSTCLFVPTALIQWHLKIGVAALVVMRVLKGIASFPLEVHLTISYWKSSCSIMKTPIVSKEGKGCCLHRPLSGRNMK